MGLILAEEAKRPRPDPLGGAEPLGIFHRKGENMVILDILSSLFAGSGNIGDVHTGYKVIAVKSNSPYESIVFAKKNSKEASTNYVIWLFDKGPGGGYHSGFYENDYEEAQKLFRER
jgi:hypothetical protein